MSLIDPTDTPAKDVTPDSIAEAIVEILGQHPGPQRIGTVAYLLEERGVIPESDSRWEIGSRKELAWWSTIYKAIDVAVRSGKVGRRGRTVQDGSRGNILFLTVREVESP